jgi:hypothetical protein
MGQIKGGKIRALAVTGRQRSAAFPDVPTFAKLVRNETQRWSELARGAGVKPE